ncbi:unnamed protein product [Lactuca saligna]|uniref:Uncharacterized protein n=1 Tax=Lactuca saligna TaxID=75948 RepID=A0AA35ZXZ1_LACSI|nr:unnamed protein product [Lactuca saligna]
MFETSKTISNGGVQVKEIDDFRERRSTQPHSPFLFKYADGNTSANRVCNSQDLSAKQCKLGSISDENMVTNNNPLVDLLILTAIAKVLNGNSDCRGEGGGLEARCTAGGRILTYQGGTCCRCLCGVLQVPYISALCCHRGIRVLELRNCGSMRI